MNFVRDWTTTETTMLHPDHNPLRPAAPRDGEPDPRAALAAALETSIRPCSALAGLDIPARQRILGEWFMEGDLGFIYAPRGLGKTWLALGLATAIAGGQDFGPWRSGGARRVLYVDGEMPCEALGARITGMGGRDDLAVLNHEALFHLTGQVLNLADPVAQSVLTARLLADGITVVFLDNLSCLFSGVKENDADAWEAVLGWLLTLRRHRIAVVLVHHSGRNKETMRGTSRREDAAFWVIRLDEVHEERREGACFRSQFTKDRNSRVEQTALEWHFGTTASGRTQVDATIASSIEIFRQWIVDGLTGAEDIAREMGVSKGTISKMAQRAIEAGWLVKHGREYALRQP